jgi:hypothetical protein
MVLTALQGGPGAVRAEFRDLRYALRQANSSWLESRRTVADSSRGPEKLSSTIRQLFCGRPSTAATRVTALIHMHMLNAEGLRAAMAQAP